MQYSGSKKICESIPNAGRRKSLVRSVGWTTRRASCSIKSDGSSRCRVGGPGALEDRTTDLPGLRAPYVSAWGSRVHPLRSRYAAQPSALVLVFSDGLRTSRSAVGDTAARVAATCRRSSLRAALPPHRSSGLPTPRRRSAAGPLTRRSARVMPPPGSVACYGAVFVAPARCLGRGRV